MMGIQDFFTRPHPFNYKGKAAWVSGLIIFLLLFMLRPFGFGELALFPRLWKSLLLGAVTCVVLLLSYGVLTRFMTNTFKQNGWLVWHDLLFSAFNMVLIGIANSLVIYFLKLSPEDLSTLLIQVVPNTFYIGFVASFLLLFLEQSLFLSSELKTLEQVNKALEQKENKVSGSADVVLLSETGLPELKLPASDIICVRSEGNYVDIFCLDENKHIQKRLLRNRLKLVADMLPSNTFFQCHRRYLVNLEHTTRLQKAGRDYALDLKYLDFPIPVSRARSSQLIQILSTRSSQKDNS